MSTLPLTFNDIMTEDRRVVLDFEKGLLAEESVVIEQISNPTTVEWEVYIQKWKDEGRI